MCADITDIAAVQPVLVLTVDPPTTLRCAGTLDAQTRHHLVAVVEQMLRAQPDSITIDVESLQIAGPDAAIALTEVQGMAKQLGASLRWHGVRADHLRQAPALSYRAARRTPGRHAASLHLE